MKRVLVSLGVVVSFSACYGKGPVAPEAGCKSFRFVDSTQAADSIVLFGKVCVR